MIADIYELSPMQRAMLFHAAYAPQSVSHFSQFSCKLTGDLKPDLFRRAWQKLVERHPVLRTSFHWEGLDKPVQVVHDQVTLPWIYQDWSSNGAQPLDDKWQEQLLADRRAGFVLDRPPLMRCLLVRTAEDQYLFNWSHHHILMDGWCLSLVLEEFFEIYEALRSQKPLGLPPAVPYRTYIEWLLRQDVGEAREYWVNYLKGFRAATELPTRRAKMRGKPEAGELVQRRLPEWLSRSLRRVASQHQLTLNILAQGAWALLLSRQSGERDVVFGATVAGRPTDLPGAGRILGLFINTIPVRVRVEDRATLVEWLKQIQARQAARGRYEYTPLSDIQRWSEGLSGGPLFDSNVIFMNYPLNETLARGAGGLIISEPQIHDQTNFLLQLQVTPGAEWTVEINYDGEGFERATAERMLDHVCALLEAFARNPTRRLSEFSLLSDAEHAQLLTDFNRSAVPFDPSDSFIHRFERAASSFPSRVAASCSGRSLSYRELNAGANRLARHILRRCPGLGTDQIVAILCRRSERMMQSILAVWKCGAAYMPLEAGDPPARLSALVKESGAKVVITEAGLLREELVAELSAHAAVVNLDELPRNVEGSEFEAESCDLARRTAASDLAYVIYTSGSTGRPKGVMVEQRGMLNHLLAKAEELGLGGRSAVAQTASHAFDISVWQFFAALLAGGRAVVYPEGVVLEPPRLLESMAGDGVEILEVVPSYLGVLLERLAERPALLEHLKYLLVTGEALSPALVESWFALTDVPVVNAYGPTEASDDITHHRMDRAAGDGAVPVGRPLRNLRVYVMDEWMNPCPARVRGEVCVGGVGVGRGYLDDPRKTAEAFVPDPFSREAGARMYRTGDIGSWTAGGDLLLHGRKDFQVKVRGHRIELAEIESALTQLDCVHEAIVRDVRDAAGHVYLCGYVTLRAGRQADGAGLARALSETLPDYMVPAAFTLLDKFPLTRNGKIDRQALPAPDLPKEARKVGHAPPRTHAERVLCLIWSEVLGVEQPGIHDNFFAFGGDSILSMQIVSRARRAGLKLLTSQVFEHQTVAELARVATPTPQAAREAGEVRGPIPPTPIQHNSSLESAAFGFTPSDFPVAGVSQSSFDELARQLKSAPRQSLGDEVEDIYELTPTQQGMLFHGLYTPSSEAYFNQVTCLLEGELDAEAFRAAWRQAIDRHPVLRTSFHWEGIEKPVQVVHRNVSLPWDDVDLSGVEETEALERWDGLLRESRALGFKMSEAPLMRWTLADLGHSRWRFNWSEHHLLLDGWSASLVLKEVLEAYAAMRAGREARQPRPRPFRDMVEWLRQRETSNAERFWRERLAGFTTPTPLVLGRPEVEGKRAPELYAKKEVFLSPSATARLVSFARNNRLSLNTMAQGAWALLLSRYSGETDVVYGTIVSGRPPELDGSDHMVGLFISTIPVRAQLDESEAAASWLKRMQTRLVEQEQYAYSPLAEIQKWSEVAGGMSLFESLLIFQNYPVAETLDEALTGVRISEFEVFDPNNYPLTLVVTPGETLSLRVLYDASRFDEETVARLTGHYQTILESIVAAPELPLEQVEMLTASEREQILSGWNQTATEVPAGKTVVDLFESHAARTPDRVALVCGNVRRTYRELSERSSALALHLQGAAPLDADDRVAIFMGRSPAMVESILAVWKCGAAYVPVDPNYPAERIERILADAKPRLILADGDAALANLPAASPVVRLDALPPSPVAPAPIASKALPHGLAYVIYTSGSTGKPKGAMVEHQGMLNHILGMVRDLEIDEESVVAETASHCFDISVWQFFAALVSGARTHIYTDEVVLRPAELARLLGRDGVTVVQFVPSYLAAFVEVLRSIHPAQPLTSLRFMVLIGEVLKPAYVHAWFALYPGVRMMNAYGPTEASDSVTHFVMERPPELASIPVGRPVQNLKVYILDKRRRLCPVGVRGEICVAGVGVGRGYLFDPERTGAVFEHDPFSEDGQGRLYHTGDIGCYAHDGNILFFGRNDFQVKIRGHRIELGDVESAITGLDGIVNAAVIAREEAGGAKYLCAYVSQSGRARWSAATLRDAMLRKLPEHMLPDVWMILPELPVTPNGKVNRRSLPEPTGQSAARPSLEPPATRVEKVLASIWQDVLGRPVGVEDRFFEVGGHSLHALRIVGRIRRDLGVDATLAQLFTSDTVRALARELSDSAPPIPTQIPALPEQAWYGASHAQKRIWLACRTAEASVAYNMAGAFQLDGRLDAAALVEALHTLVKRHESLRTVFALMGGELKQQVRSPEECGFAVERLEAPSSVADLIAAEAERPFNLAEGPLFRAALTRVGEESHLLLLTMHHIVSDAWSVRVLVKELRALYDAFRSGRPSPLEPLPVQYRDYAAWHNRMLESPEMRSQRDYWKRRLGPHVPRLELPTDYPHAARNGRAAGRVASLVERDTVKGLSGLARRHGTSLFGAVLASICVLLYRYTGQQEIVIGFQSAGRDRHQLEDQVGVYLNTVVLSARLEPAASIAETVSSVGRALLEALRHGDYPFDLLLEELRPRTPANRSPIFDVQVDYVPDLDQANSADARPEITITDLSQDAAHTKYDISFLIFESADRLEVVTVYDANLFRRETVETMHRRLAAIQKAFLEDEGRMLGEIELFGETTRAAGRRVEVGLRLSKDK
jgi:amino acid adenylation domain-containing protein